LEKQQKLNEEVRKLVIQSKKDKYKVQEKRNKVAAGLEFKGAEKSKRTCRGSKGKQ
jgi:hypothetical protein